MARVGRQPESGITILVVDDQEEVLVSCRQLLEREGHRVLTADGGERALALFDAHDVHLVLVDFFMPRMSGEELINAIRARDPLVQIILQTGYAGEKPARTMLAELDIHSYHDKGAGPDKLLVWVDVAIKAHRTVQSLLERDRVFNELLANVSHELRTPLNILGGYADLLLDGSYGPVPAPARPVLEAIGGATEALNIMVNEFLGNWGGGNSPSETRLEVIDLFVLTQEIGRLGALLVDGTGVAFRVESTAAPSTLVTAPSKLRTILRHLVINAARFTARGEIVVRLGGDREQVRFEIADTGPGIAVDDLEGIFEPFGAPGAPDATARRGSGRGLPMSRKLARLLGGDLRVESTPGRGSIFTLLLPTQPDNAAPTARTLDGPPRAALG